MAFKIKSKHSLFDFISGAKPPSSPTEVEKLFVDKIPLSS